MIFWVAFVTAMLGILLVRQYRGFEMQRQYDLLRAQVRVDNSRREALESEIANRKSRSVLGPIAVGLGLRAPSDSEQVVVDVSRPD